MLQVKGGANADAVAQSTAQAIGSAVATAVASASTKVTTTGGPGHADMLRSLGQGLDMLLCERTCMCEQLHHWCSATPSV